MKLYDVPSAKNLACYKSPPQSGNDINGLGITTTIRAKRVFHALGRANFAWEDMNNFFIMNATFNTLRKGFKFFWNLRKAGGPVNEQQTPVSNTAEMTAHIKSKAKEFGAELVGITTLIDQDHYDDVRPRYKYAISIGIHMDREEMLHVPHERAAIEVQRIYAEVAKTAIELAQYIRQLGWPAHAYGDPNSTDVLQIPVAIRAGLGELGKHGSLICTEFGSNVRLSMVTTDLPLGLDEAVDIGVDDLCLGCRRCTTDCPPGAILDEKQWVRGVKRWYVDFDKCVPYFSSTYGCAICIEVCPWSEPERGPKLSQTLLAKRQRNKN